MSVSARPQSALRTFAIFALIGPVVSALLLFLPNIPNFFRWAAVDSRIWLGLLDAVLFIYPIGIWPWLIAGAAVAWRDRTNGNTPLIFAIIVSLIAGMLWLAALELYLLQQTLRSLFSETNVMRLIVSVAAGIFCWWLSRAKTEKTAA